MKEAKSKLFYEVDEVCLGGV